MQWLFSKNKINIDKFAYKFRFKNLNMKVVENIPVCLMIS